LSPRRQVFAEIENAEEYSSPDEVIIKDDLVSARIKGTWVMTWGESKFDFEDGKRYRIPRDLFQYLKARSCIYDTL
jgi:hypothetical protein